MKFRTALSYLLLFSSCMYVLWFLAQLLMNNSFAADDWFFLSQLREMNAFEVSAAWYQNYGGRWFSYFLEAAILSGQGEIPSLLFSFILLLLFHFSLFFFIHSFLKKSNASVSKVESLTYTLLLSFSLWIALPNPGEFFTWLSSSVIYLCGCTLLLFLLAFYFNKASLLIQIPLLILFTGTSELFVLAYLIFLAYVYFHSSYDKKILVTLFSVGAGFLLLNVLSPGSMSRVFMLSDAPGEDAPFYVIRTGGHMIIQFLSDQWWVFPCVFLLGAVFGKESMLDIPFRKRMLYYFITLFILTVPALIILHDSPPLRIMAVPKLAFLLFIFLEGMCFGEQQKFLRNIWVKVPLALFLIMAGLFLTNSELNIAAKYSESVERRMELIRSSSKTDSDTIVVPPLAPSGLLYSAEITKNADHYLNRHLSSGLGLNYKIVRGD